MVQGFRSPSTGGSKRLGRLAVAASVGALLLVAAGPASAASASVSYTYDQLGRVTTARYDNGVCIAYTYDAVGNRTAQMNTQSGAAQTPVYGTGTWGCFAWTAQGGARAKPGEPSDSTLASLSPTKPELARPVGVAPDISSARSAAQGQFEGGQ